MNGHEMPLPSGYRAVTPSIDDVPRATQFFDLVEISEWGEPDFDEDEVRDEWEELDLEASVVLVEDTDGSLVAGMTLLLSNGVTWEAFGYVHPDHRGRGLGTWIVDWSETMASHRAVETRDGYEVAILNYTSTVNAEAQRLMSRRGYDIVRVFRRMRIDLHRAPAPVVWPEGFEIREFQRERDARGFYAALDRAFADHWSASPRSFEQWSKHWLGDDADTGLWVQLMHGDDVVGLCCGRRSGDSGWIGYVGVVPEFRRQGLAKSILRDSFRRFWERGITRVELGVDSENRQRAVDLYLGVGMQESHSYETNRKVLRPGRDWREDDEA